MNTLLTLFDNPKRSAAVALALGLIGGILTAIAFGIENGPLVVIGIVILMASGVTWAIRGVREDQVAADT